MDNFKKLFNNVHPVDQPKGLSETIFARIQLEKKKRAKIRILYTSTAGVLSLIASIPAIGYFAQEFSQSGFYQYLTLIFSDGGVALTYWKELSLSLVESLPVLGIVILLSLALVILGSFKYIIQDSKTLFARVQLA